MLEGNNFMNMMNKKGQSSLPNIGSLIRLFKLPPEKCSRSDRNTGRRPHSMF